MDIITSEGLTIDYFESGLASIIGNIPGTEGDRVVAQAAALGRKRIELCDWFFCLAKTPSTVIWKKFIEDQGIAPDEFVKIINEGLDFPSEEHVTSSNRVVRGNISDDVIDMLNKAFQLKGKSHLIDEHKLTQALLENANESLRDQLNLWLGGPDKLNAILRGFEQQTAIVNPLTWISEEI